MSVDGEPQYIVTLVDGIDPAVVNACGLLRDNRVVLRTTRRKVRVWAGRDRADVLRVRAFSPTAASGRSNRAVRVLNSIRVVPG